MAQDIVVAPAIASPRSTQLTTAQKIMYGSSGLGLGCIDYIVAVYLLKYYTDHVALSATLAGVALMLGKVLDGVSDPIMGYISDRTPTRWGRRRPWFLVGVAPFVLSFIAMFSADATWSQTTLFFWLLAGNVLLWSGQTVIDVPHATLGGELAEGHHERNSIMGWRQGLSQVGLLIGAAAPILIISAAQDKATAAALTEGLTQEAAELAGMAARGAAHGTMAWRFGGLAFIGVFLSFVGTREPDRAPAIPRGSAFGNFADTFKNRPFRLFVLVFMIEQVASGFMASLILYAIQDWWHFDQGWHESLLIMSYVVAAFASIPLWLRFGREYEKATLFAIGCFMTAGALVGSLFSKQLGLTWGYCMMVAAGAGMAVRSVMAMSMVPDIIDDDEVHTHSRKDGAYFGMWSLTRKLARALSMGALGVGLSWWGYQEGAPEQPDTAVAGIRWMFAIIPMIVYGVCGFLILRFPLDRAAHRLALAELHRRRDVEDLG